MSEKLKTMKKWPPKKGGFVLKKTNKKRPFEGIFKNNFFLDTYIYVFRVFWPEEFENDLQKIPTLHQKKIFLEKSIFTLK